MVYPTGQGKRLKPSKHRLLDGRGLDWVESPCTHFLDKLRAMPSETLISRGHFLFLTLSQENVRVEW